MSPSAFSSKLLSNTMPRVRMISLSCYLSYKKQKKQCLISRCYCPSSGLSCKELLPRTSLLPGFLLGLNWALIVHLPDEPQYLCPVCGRDWFREQRHRRPTPPAHLVISWYFLRASIDYSRHALYAFELSVSLFRFLLLVSACSCSTCCYCAIGIVCAYWLICFESQLELSILPFCSCVFASSDSLLLQSSSCFCVCVLSFVFSCPVHSPSC